MNRFSDRRPRRNSERRPYPQNNPNLDGYSNRSKRLPSSKKEQINFNTGTIAVLAGVLILGVGIGSAITS